MKAIRPLPVLRVGLTHLHLPEIELEIWSIMTEMHVIFSIGCKYTLFGIIELQIRLSNFNVILYANGSDRHI